MRRHFGAVWIAILLGAVFMVQPATSLEDPLSNDQALSVSFYAQDGSPIDGSTSDYYVRVRHNFGLDDSSETVQAIIDEFGIAFEWGFPLTPGELEDLLARTELAGEFSNESVLGFAELPDYAGFYFDQRNGGVPTVLLATDDPDIETVLLAVPPDLRDRVVIGFAEYSWAELVESFYAIAESTNVSLREEIHRVAVKVIDNRLEVSVESADRLAEVQSELINLIDVDFELVVEPRSEPQVCSSREACYSPHRGGIRLDAGSKSGTLGFAILHNGDKQFLASGHLPASTYSHNIYNLGSTAENEWVQNGADMRAIYTPDSQVSDDIYISSTLHRDVVGLKYPSVGLPVCMTGWKTLSCGSVQDNYLTWNDGTYTVFGASADYNSASGDSGAPVYQISGSSGAYAVGVHATGTGDREFARIYDISSRMGALILTS